MQLHYNKTMQATCVFLQLPITTIEVDMTRPILKSESSLTARYQTTIPDTVRKALHLHKRDKICYTVQSDGHVLLSRVDEAENDPVLHEFLSFLANDMQANPQHLNVVSSELRGRIQTLVSGVNIDLNEPLPDDED